jgi:hypothetical protein
MPFKKGHKIWVGKHRIISEAQKIKISLSIKGKHHSEETKRKIRLSMQGKKNALGLKRNYDTLKKMSESHKGDKCYNWQGGKSFELYSPNFNKELKKNIREKYNFRCQICFKTENDFKRKLSVHHIDYNKMDNDSSNLICLCNSCHLKTNYNREFWEYYFKYIKNMIIT